MPNIRSESRLGGSCRHYSLSEAERPVTYAAAIASMQENVGFRDLLIRVLSGSSYRAFRWETPPITRRTVDRPFEFVLVDAPDLEGSPDQVAFRSHFNAESVVTFENLGRDALLIAPCPRAESEVYTHLAAFVRGAPSDQIHALWQSLGRAVNARLSDRPLWVSTAGGGVAWLHVRLDSRPKYYAYSVYKTLD